MFGYRIHFENTAGHEHHTANRDNQYKNAINIGRLHEHLFGRIMKFNDID